MQIRFQKWPKQKAELDGALTTVEENTSKKLAVEGKRKVAGPDRGPGSGSREAQGVLGRCTGGAEGASEGRSAEEEVQIRVPAAPKAKDPRINCIGLIPDSRNPSHRVEAESKPEERPNHRVENVQASAGCSRALRSGGRRPRPDFRALFPGKRLAPGNQFHRSPVGPLLPDPKRANYAHHWTA